MARWICWKLRRVWPWLILIEVWYIEFFIWSDLEDEFLKGLPLPIIHWRITPLILNLSQTLSLSHHFSFSPSIFISLSFHIFLLLIYPSLSFSFLFYFVLSFYFALFLLLSFYLFLCTFLSFSLPFSVSFSYFSIQVQSARDFRNLKLNFEFF